MTGTRVFRVLAVATAVGALGASAAVGGDRAETNLKYNSINDGGPVIKHRGTVASPKRSCEQGRKVAVFRRQPGNDEKVGSARSRPSGDRYTWTVSEEGKFSGVNYYAKAKRTAKCKAARAEYTGPSR